MSVGVGGRQQAKDAIGALLAQLDRAAAWSGPWHCLPRALPRSLAVGPDGVLGNGGVVCGTSWFAPCLSGRAQPVDFERRTTARM